MKRFLVAGSLLGLALGCELPKPKPEFNWHGHEQMLYALMMNHANLEAYGKFLRQQIDQQPEGEPVPPGICGDYGFVLLSTGNAKEAERYFLLERTTWPESRVLMDRLIASCHHGTPPQAEPSVATPTPVKP